MPFFVTRPSSLGDQVTPLEIARLRSECEEAGRTSEGRTNSLDRIDISAKMNASRVGIPEQVVISRVQGTEFGILS
jgi:hypothetical protein